MTNTATLPSPLPLPGHKRHWREAYRHFRLLLANKEDTTHVFHITRLLNGDDLYKSYNRFIRTEGGVDAWRKRRYYPDILDDRARLRAMPEGSLAHAYCDFMDQEGLTAKGLVDEFDRFLEDVDDDRSDDFKWFNNLTRDTHDMQHVLTGYGRDALGEICVLAFDYERSRAFGIKFISWLGQFDVRKWAPKNAPILRAVREAARRGKRAQAIIDYDLLDLLPRPLDEVREMLGVEPMVWYPKVHEAMYAAGIDPYEAVGGPVEKRDALASTPEGCCAA